jgi:hypothetical protein
MCFSHLFVIGRSTISIYIQFKKTNKMRRNTADAIIFALLFR